MVRAPCTDMPYMFKVLHGGTFSTHSSYGVIALNGFSGVGVVQERSEECRYWSSVFYMGPPNNRDIHFTVTRHTDAHIATIKNQYMMTRNAVLGPEQALLFNGSTIALDVPKDGIDMQDGWKLIPATPPQIRKNEVDDHRPRNETVPHCELVAVWTKDEAKIKGFMHTVNIRGTTEEKYFIIRIHPERKESTQKRQRNTTDDTSAPRHAQVTRYLRSLANHELVQLGSFLGLHHTHLRRMSCGTLLDDMVQAWLRKDDGVLQASGLPSWTSLANALEIAGKTGIASDIRRDLFQE